MKKLIIVNGTMGSGKSSLCNELLKQLNNAIWLDGDWCWMMNPWNISDENKKMVIDNITHLLNNYLTNNSFEYVLFSWVLNKKEILDLLLDKLENNSFKLFVFTVTCSENIIEERLKRRGLSDTIIKDAIGRLGDYFQMESIFINSSKSMENNVEKISEIIKSDS
jgi:broad-specificity NMP kinase